MKRFVVLWEWNTHIKHRLPLRCSFRASGSALSKMTSHRVFGAALSCFHPQSLIDRWKYKHHRRIKVAIQWPSLDERRQRPGNVFFFFFFNNYAYCPNTLGRLCVCILSNHCLLWPTWKKKKNVASRRVSWTHFPVVFFCCCFVFPPSFILHEICALDFSSVLRCKLKRSPDVLQTVRNIWG